MSGDLVLTAPSGPEKPATRTLNKRQQHFIRLMVSGVKQGLAYEKAYAAKPTTADANANRLLKAPAIRQAIHEAIETQMVAHKVTATRVAGQLLETAQSEKVKLDTVKAVWDRSGLAASRGGSGGLGNGLSVVIRLANGHAGERAEPITITVNADQRDDDPMQTPSG